MIVPCEIHLGFLCLLATMAVAHLLLQHSVANAARNRVVPPAILLILQLLCGGLDRN